jgi:3D (Asp-Asp-Asp) domain-containing protein
MKLFLRGGAGLVVTLFASLLIFYARPLSAEVNPSPEPATQQQQENQEPAQAAQQKREAEATTTTAPTETARLSSAVTAAAAPSEPEVKPTESLLASAPQLYNATSYSRPGRGASGMGVRFGTIAADPKVLPFGTRVRLDAGQYTGEYVVTDSGTAIKGRKIDIWLPTFREACRFGRRNVKLTVLSYGGKRSAKRAR